MQFFLGKPALAFHPYEYGNGYTKLTHLWGNFNAPAQNIVEASKIKFDHTKVDELPSLPDGYIYDKGCGLDKRQVRRSITPDGFAKAFFTANQ